MTSRPDWTKAANLPPDELAGLLDEDRDEIDDNPPMTDEELAAMRPAVECLPPGLYAALSKRRPGQRGPGKRPAKVLLTVRVEPETLAAWKATGPGWQGRVNAILKSAILASK